MTSQLPLCALQAFISSCSKNLAKVKNFLYLETRLRKNDFLMFRSLSAHVLSPNADQPVATHSVTSSSMVIDAIFVPRKSIDDVEKACLEEMPWLDRFELYFLCEQTERRHYRFLSAA